jgi:hypothetical protein
VTPAIGAVYTAPWGSRYVVHRLAGDEVVLRDLDRPTACVLETPAELAARYTATGEVRTSGAHQLAQEPAPAPAAPAAADPPPAAPTSRQAGVRRRCGGCGLPAIALAVADSGAEYCFRCYGVSAQQREATGALSTSWRPPAGEDYESRTDVGSFAPPPPEQQRPRERPPRKPARVEANEWLALTGERPR